MGVQILIALGVALAGAIVAMLVSGTTREMTLATTKFENMGDQHH
ncbi:MAG: hypothetical protein ACOY40_11445 [Bacillota bacterium]